MVAASEKALSETGVAPDRFFFTHRAGRAAEGDLADALAGYEPLASEHPYWDGTGPQSMLIDEVEAIWAAIADADDWQPLSDKVAAMREMGAAHGAPPLPAGHVWDTVTT